MADVMFKVSEQLSLKNKTVVLTGATGILGRHFAEAFVQAGADVALIDQEQKSLDELAYNLEKEYNKKVKAYACNLISEDEVSRVIKNIRHTPQSPLKRGSRKCNSFRS